MQQLDMVEGDDEDYMVMQQSPVLSRLGVKRSRGQPAYASPFKRQVLMTDLSGQAFGADAHLGSPVFWPAGMSCPMTAPIQEDVTADHTGGGVGGALAVAFSSSQVTTVAMQADVLPGLGSGIVHVSSGPQESDACGRECGHLAMSVLRLHSREICAALGIPAHDIKTQVLREPKRDVLLRSISQPSGCDGGFEGTGAATFLALLQAFTEVPLLPGVAVIGDVTLVGKLVDPGYACAVSSLMAALPEGCDRVVVASGSEEKVMRVLRDSVNLDVVWVDDIMGLLCHTVAAPVRPVKLSSRHVVVSPTLLPYDDVLMCMRSVEAATLPHLGRGGGSVKVTGVRDECGLSCVRAAVNSARFVVQKRQDAITSMLGPPSVDLRTMTRVSPPAASPAKPPFIGFGGTSAYAGRALRGSHVDIHIHIPQALPTAAYGVPIMLALIGVVWDREPAVLRSVASIGELDALGCFSLHERIRPSFFSSVALHGVRRVLLARAQAMAVLRSDGGFGDSGTLSNGVTIQGVDRSALDLVRAVYMG